MFSVGFSVGGGEWGDLHHP